MSSQTSNQNSQPFSANVDHQEIEKFAALAHSWWDLNGEFKPLHLMNPFSNREIHPHPN